MIRIKRLASRAKPNDHDVKFVMKRDLRRYLKAGWKEFKAEDPLPLPEPVEANGFIAPKDLTDEQKKDIVDAEGTQREIAKRFGVSNYTVHRLKTGKLL